MADFSHLIIAWQRSHGRHTLPWQGTRDPYRIWVSEIMLQQTQVASVIPFYARFIDRFPDVSTLAAATLDEVLALWSGLGYYSRARHLHAASRIVCKAYDNRFPQTLEAAAALPGIGRSTAAAILVFSHGARHAILDGNVKRVLARCFGIRGYPGEPEVNRTLWRHAEESLPRSDIEAYTQGLMDLGSLVCTRSRPRCAVCPLRRECVALREGCAHELPTPRSRKALPEKTTIMLVLEHDKEILMERRPPAGIWGGLWSLPEIGSGEDAARACAARYGAAVAHVESLPPIAHTFTHFRLTITPQRLRAITRPVIAAEANVAWWRLDAAHAAGVPAPVRRIVEALRRARANCEAAESRR